MNIEAIDLFCGAGGLTHGLVSMGIDVKLGIDCDVACSYPYTKNNNAKFILDDVKNIKGKDLVKYFSKDSIKVLAGCAPCQPFSKYTQGLIGKSRKGDKWSLLKEFSGLVKEVNPDIVTMENVPQLIKHDVYFDFEKNIKKLGYKTSVFLVSCPSYGIPQSRKRLVFLASKLGEINLIPETHTESSFVTVRDVIAKLPKIKSGEQDKKDPLHRASLLSPINMKRIKQSKPGGSWKDWSEDLVADCHKKNKGSSYVSVYGRMLWDAPSPTITTQCIGFGNGRFGHPEQDRAISLREAALLQTFPVNYKFVDEKNKLTTKQLSTLIGNAVPVKLGSVVAESIIKHIKDVSDGQKNS